MERHLDAELGWFRYSVSYMDEPGWQAHKRLS